MIKFNRNCFSFLAIVVFSFSSIPLHANETTGPDYEREQRIAAQIEPDIFDGESVWLSANDHQFLGIHLVAEESRGAVILLHGRDVNPEEQELINPLRVGLSESGWTTLAIQMPVLAKGKQYNDYLPILSYSHQRIESAIRYLREQGETQIILAAHSCGAHMAHSWFNLDKQHNVDAYIAMGSGATDKNQPLQTPLPFANLSIPVLDIYGSAEFPAPLAMVPDRKQMLFANGLPQSEQVKVEGANHYFSGYGDRMVGELSRWLNTLPL